MTSARVEHNGRLTPVNAIAATCLVLLVLMLASAVAPPCARASSAIGLSAGLFEFSTVKGRTLKGDLYVSNEGDTPIQVLVYTSDIVPDAKGVPQFVRPAAGVQPTSDSPASWTTVKAPDSTRIINNAPYLALAVGERSHVLFQIDVPDAVQPGDYSEAIFFEMFNVGKAKGTTSRIGGRLGCRVRVRVQGKITESVSVRPFGVGAVALGPTLPYDFTINNGSNIDHEFASTLQILDSDEQVRQKVVVGKADYVYARKKKVFEGRAPLTGVGMGKYTAELRVSYFKESMGAGGKIDKTRAEIVKQRIFYVVPYSLVIPVAVAVLALLLFVLTIPARRRRREARREPGPTAVGEVPGPTAVGEAPAEAPVEWQGQAPIREQPPVQEQPTVREQPPEETWWTDRSAAPEAPAEPDVPVEPEQPITSELDAPAQEEILPEEEAGEVAAVEEEASPEGAAKAEAADQEAPEAEPAEEETPEKPGEEPGEEPGQEPPDWKKSWGSDKYYGPGSGGDERKK